MAVLLAKHAKAPFLIRLVLLPFAAKIYPRVGLIVILMHDAHQICGMVSLLQLIIEFFVSPDSTNAWSTFTFDARNIDHIFITLPTFLGDLIFLSSAPPPASLILHDTEWSRFFQAFACLA